MIALIVCAIIFALCAGFIGGASWAVMFEDRKPGEPEAECKHCGCTDSSGCIHGDGHPCYWISVDRDTRVGECSCCVLERLPMKAAMRMGEYSAYYKPAAPEPEFAHVRLAGDVQ